jgi:hypothetical protein
VLPARSQTTNQIVICYENACFRAGHPRGQLQNSNGSKQ